MNGDPNRPGQDQPNKPGQENPGPKPGTPQPDNR